MHRLTRTLSSINSAESYRFYSVAVANHRPYSNLRSLDAPFTALNLTYTSKSRTFSTLNRRLTPPPPPRMDSNPMAASGVEDFVHVDGGNHNSVSETSDESVVEERVIDEEVSSVSGEGQSQGYERKDLPEELEKSVMKLTCESSADGGICDVYVVGTAHVSAESCEVVKAVIDFLKPQVVFLELCSGRVAILAPHSLKIPTTREMVDMWRKNQNPFGILYSWFLAKVANKLEVFPGAEFRVGYEEAMKYGGKVILGDRPVQITLRRTWAKMPLWHKMKLVFSLLFQAVFLPKPEDLNRMLKEMDDVDMLTLVIQEMSKQFPTLMDTLVHERDQFMSSTLLRVASEHNSVVAVVGKGHLPGIKKYWKQPIEVKELLSIPAPRPFITVRRVLTTVGVAVAGVAIISGIYSSSKK